MAKENHRGKKYVAAAAGLNRDEMHDLTAVQPSRANRPGRRRVVKRRYLIAAARPSSTNHSVGEHQAGSFAGWESPRAADSVRGRNRSTQLNTNHRHVAHSNE